MTKQKRERALLCLNEKNVDFLVRIDEASTDEEIASLLDDPQLTKQHTDYLTRKRLNIRIGTICKMSFEEGLRSLVDHDEVDYVGGHMITGAVCKHLIDILSNFEEGSALHNHLYEADRLLGPLLKKWISVANTKEQVQYIFQYTTPGTKPYYACLKKALTL